MFNFLATNAVTRAFLFLACIALTTGAPIGSTNDKDVIPNQWIVMFKDTTPDTVFAGYQKMFRKRSENSTVSVKHVYNAGSLRGFSLDGSLEDMESLDNEWVQTIEPNRRIYLDDMEQDTRNVSSLVSRGSRGTSTEGPWNLDQISHFGPVGKGPQPGRYLCPENCGAGVTIYIVDTGVDIDHPELTGRAEIGASFCDDQEDSRDLIGHGTHVAGIAAGKTHGVASGAQIISVKALGCKGKKHGQLVDLIRAIEWVLEDVMNKNLQGKAVMNLSISGKRDSKQLRGDMWAARKSVNTGIFVSAAAGNNNRPAGEYAPGAEPAVCTVGAVDREGNESTFSNYGSVVDILAPGQDIEAAQLGGGMVKMKGTSMAAPHVAGVAATWLSAGFAAVDGLCAELTRAGEPATKSKAGTTNRMVQNKAWAAWEGSY